MRKLVLRFLEDDSGATAIEYGLIAGRHFGRDHCRGQHSRHQPQRDIHQHFQPAEIVIVPNSAICTAHGPNRGLFPSTSAAAGSGGASLHQAFNCLRVSAPSGVIRSFLARKERVRNFSPQLGDSLGKAEGLSVKKIRGDPGVLLPGYPPGPVYQGLREVGLGTPPRPWPLSQKFHKLVSVPTPAVDPS